MPQSDVVVGDGLEGAPTTSGHVLADFDALRVEVAGVIADRARWQAEAERQIQAADQATGRADVLLVQLEEARSELGRLQIESEARERDAETTRVTLTDQLSRAQTSLEQARGERDRLSQQVDRHRQRSERLQHELQELYRLYRAQRMEQANNLYERIVQISVELVDAEKGVWFRSVDGFEPLATYHFDDLDQHIDGLRQVAHRVAADQKPVILNTPDEIASCAGGSTAFHDVAAYPIIIHEQLAGVVIVVNKHGDGFTDEDERLLLGIGSHAAVAIENRRLRRDIEDAYASTVALLCNVIEAKDPYTRGHCEEVASLAAAVARELGMSGEEQEIIFQAGLLHDVGKIAVSDGILLKPGRLLPAERDVIETHSVIGADLVSSVPSLRAIAPLILHHHERYDGDGYPRKLKAHDIPLSARIICAVDAWAAMTSARPYRSALDPQAVRDELHRTSGSQFDPNVVEALLRVLDHPQKRHDAWMAMADDGSVVRDAGV